MTRGSPGGGRTAASCRYRWFHRVWRMIPRRGRGKGFRAHGCSTGPPDSYNIGPCVDRGASRGSGVNPLSHVLSQGWAERPGRPPLEVHLKGRSSVEGTRPDQKPSHKMRPRVIFLTPDRWFHRGALACPGHARDITESRKGLDPCAKTYKVGRQMVPRFAAGPLTPQKRGGGGADVSA